jgi:hypothetical protein
VVAQVCQDSLVAGLYGFAEREDLAEEALACLLEMATKRMEPRSKASRAFSQVQPLSSMKEPQL